MSDRRDGRERNDQSVQSDRRDQQSDRDRDRSDSRDRDRRDSDARSRDGRQSDVARGIEFGRRTDRGLTVRTIERNNIFFNSGLRDGDIIVTIDNRPLRNESDFRRFVAVRSGHRVPIVVFRNGERRTIYFEPSEDVVANDSYDNRQSQSGGQAVLGVTFDPQARQAVVRSVTPGGPAEHAGLQPGDVIVAINREPVRSDRDAIGIIRSMRPGDRATIAFERQLETEAVLDGQSGGPVHTAAYPPAVGPEQESTAPVQGERTEVDRRDRSDGRGILNRNRNDNTNRPLRPRLLD
jgi:S1-C subfamily serine protease